MDIADLQELIRATYGAKDTERGLPSTVAWLAEEVGELAQAVRKGTTAQQVHELGDVIAWVASLANQLDGRCAGGVVSTHRDSPGSWDGWSISTI